MRTGAAVAAAVAVSLSLLASPALGLDVVTMAIPTKSFQMVIYPLAQERGYMREEGIDLRVTVIEPIASVQALIAGDIQFTGAGTSALVAITKGAAPLKVVLAVNDRVHQWLLARPEIAGLQALRGKKIATTGVAAAATFMLKQILAKHGLDPNRDVGMIGMGAGAQLKALLAGAVDAAVVSVDQRYVGLDGGMREVVYFGAEVKNSWGTLATADRLLTEQPRLVGGFLKATLKALRFIRQDREATIAAVVKFSGVQRAQAARVYDDLIGTFTASGVVDEETQTNDLAVFRQVIGARETVPIARAYDFGAALEADRQLTQAGWRP
jgi:ABC-type nitrate/sulfonate/bicarbonate transport system substrate-binding protein